MATSSSNKGSRVFTASESSHSANVPLFDVQAKLAAISDETLRSIVTAQIKQNPDSELARAVCDPTPTVDFSTYSKTIRDDMAAY